MIRDLNERAVDRLSHPVGRTRLPHRLLPGRRPSGGVPQGTGYLALPGKPAVGEPGVGGDPADEILGPADPDLRADPGFQREAGLGEGGRLVGPAEAPGEPGQQAVDGASAVTGHPDNGKLAGVRCELVIQPPGVGEAERGGDLGPEGDRLGPGP